MTSSVFLLFKGNTSGGMSIL